MARARPSRLFDRRFARHLGRLVAIYWKSPAARTGVPLLALAIALELGGVYGTVLLSLAEKRIFDAVQMMDMSGFLAGVGSFGAVMVVAALVSAYRIYVRQWLEMHWRQNVTAHYLGNWVGPQAYVQQEVHAQGADNPDQRIAEDTRNFVASSLGLSLSLLSAFATLYSFSGVLWRLSADWPLKLDGMVLRVPGLMLWIAVAYSFLAIALTHLVGRPLVPINFNRQRVEADFRYGLVRLRENIEAVAVGGGSDFERLGSIGRFRAVVENWWQLVAAQRNLSLFTTLVGHANTIVPLVISAPAFFAGQLSLGSVAQMRVAYGQVSGALSWFVFAYQEIAQWRASVERLATFSEVIDAAREDLVPEHGVRSERIEGTSLRFADVRLHLPDGRFLLRVPDSEVKAGERLAVIGPVGSGKTTLFRALAGVWPFGSGSIGIPKDARVMFLPQEPYLPMGSLRETVSYPSHEVVFADADVKKFLEALQLGRLGDRLDEKAPWDQHLTIDEQQRLSIMRVLLHRPDWVFMDDATAALDEEMERLVYEMISAHLPRASVVTISHRAGLAKYHHRSWSLQPNGQGRLTVQVNGGAHAPDVRADG